MGTGALDPLYSTFNSQLFWGFISLIFAAGAFSGKLSMNASTICLALAWFIGCVGIYRSDVIRDWYLMVASWFALGTILALLAAWFRPSVTDALNKSVSPSSHFDIRLDNLYFVPIGSWTDIRLSGTALVVVVSVRNRGAPSVAEEWNLTIQVGENEYKGQEITPPDTFFFNYTRIECLRLYGKDSLMRKTLTPIPSEDMVRGILIYDFPDVSQEELMREHTVIRLECKDFYKETSQGIFLMLDAKRSHEVPLDITKEIGSCSDIQTRSHSRQPKQ